MNRTRVLLLLTAGLATFAPAPVLSDAPAAGPGAAPGVSPPYAARIFAELGTAAPPAPELTEDDWARLCAGETLLEHALAQDAEGKSRARGVATAVIRAPAVAVWQAVTDYEAMPQFMPRLTGAGVYAFTERTVSSRFELKVLWKEIAYHLVNRLDPERLRIEWDLDPDRVNDIRQTTGSWQLHSLPDGSTLTVYSLLVDTGHAMPRWLEDYMTRRDLPGVVEALRRRVESGGTYRKE